MEPRFRIRKYTGDTFTWGIPRDLNPKNCGTCRHWGEVEEVKGVGECATIEHVKRGDRAMYKCDDDTNWDDHYVGEARAHVVDGSDWFAALRTKETFACNLHEPREG